MVNITNKKKHMKNKNQLYYKISTGLLTLLMGFSATMYIVQNEMVASTFGDLGFPTWIIYPLATAKVLGLIAIWSNKSKTLKEFAYAGFMFDTLLAAGAHLSINDGGFAPALVGLGIVLTSYFFNSKLTA
jgi:hypothetical protein